MTHTMHVSHGQLRAIGVLSPEFAHLTREAQRSAAWKVLRPLLENLGSLFFHWPEGISRRQLPAIMLLSQEACDALVEIIAQATGGRVVERFVGDDMRLFLEPERVHLVIDWDVDAALQQEQEHAEEDGRP